MRLFFTSLLCLLFLSSCFARAVVDTPVNDGNLTSTNNDYLPSSRVNQLSDEVNKPLIEAVTQTAQSWPTPDPLPIPLPDPLRLRAAEIAASMDDRLLAAQVLISGIDGNGTLPSHMKTLLEEAPAGGIMFFRYNLNLDNNSIINFTDEIVSFITEKSGIAPFLSVDHEGGAVNRFRRGTVEMGGAYTYWELAQKEGHQAALEKLEKDSANAGRELAALGINMNLAPVAEYLNDDNRDFLQYRSYGPDPLFNAEAAAAFLRGMEQNGVMCVVKHFPGTSGNDPHYEASVIDIDINAFYEYVSPFRNIIQTGQKIDISARAVMIAHTKIPVIDNQVASLSSVYMKDILRDDWGFDGIIIADDFTMAAAGNMPAEEAAILSIAAGADMVLVWQHILRRTHREFTAALQDGRLSRERLQDAAARIIYEKLRMGMIID